MGMGFRVLFFTSCVAAAAQAPAQTQTQTQPQAAPSAAGATSQAAAANDSSKRQAAAAAAQAMERAQRQAASPMRAILEAAKLQRRPLEAESVPPQVARRAAVASAVASAPAAAVAAQIRDAAATMPRPTPPSAVAYCASVISHSFRPIISLKFPSDPGKKRARLPVTGAGHIPGDDLLSQDLSSHYHWR